METISNQTCTKCQHCGEWTNYADDPHHKARMANLTRNEKALHEIANNDRKTVLHLLRNPWGWSDDVVREARLKAADELERLWRLESDATALAKELSDLVPNVQGKGQTPQAAVPLDPPVGRDAENK